MSANHYKQTPTLGIHCVIAWYFANAAARIAFTPISGIPINSVELTSESIGRLGRDVDTGDVYILDSIAPNVWSAFGGGGGGSQDWESVLSNGNATGPYDALISAGQRITDENAGEGLNLATLDNPTGTPGGMNLTAGSSTTNGGAYISLTSGDGNGNGSGHSQITLDGGTANGGDVTLRPGIGSVNGIVNVIGRLKSNVALTLTALASAPSLPAAGDYNLYIRQSDGYVIEQDSSGVLRVIGPSAGGGGGGSFPGYGSPVNVGTTNTDGIQTTVARSDHVHALSFATVNSILGTANASVNVNSQKIINLLTPTLSTDAATKGYVDGYLSSYGALTNVAASTILPDDTAAVGVAVTAARADHKHAITAAAPTATFNFSSTNSEGAATTFARSDHSHAFSTPSAPADVTKAAASAGSAANFARSDHKHDITTANVANIGTVNIEGTATTIARSDHVHALPFTIVQTLLGGATGTISINNQLLSLVATPVVGTDAANKAYVDGYFSSYGALTNTAASTIQPDDAAAVGVAVTAARADHKHAIVAAAPSTNLDFSATNAEGVATSFARSDHTHAFTTPGAPVNVTKAAAAAGSANSFARSDHKHDITTAVVSSVGTSNIEGTATSLSRSDHVHDIAFTTIQTRLGGASGSISVNSQQIINLLTPTLATDAANKGYVDGYAQPLSAVLVKGKTTGPNNITVTNSAYIDFTDGEVDIRKNGGQVLASASGVTALITSLGNVWMSDNTSRYFQFINDGYTASAFLPFYKTGMRIRTDAASNTDGRFITIEGGQALGGNRPGGNITLTAGLHTGAASPAHVFIRPANASNVIDVTQGGEGGVTSQLGFFGVTPAARQAPGGPISAAAVAGYLGITGLFNASLITSGQSLVTTVVSSSPYICTGAEELIYVDNSAGQINITLPNPTHAISGTNPAIWFKLTEANGFPIQINPFSTESIDGYSGPVLFRKNHGALLIAAGGSGLYWNILYKGTGTTSEVNSLTSVASSPYVITPYDEHLAVSTASARSLNLPNPSLRREFIVADSTGSAATNNITLVRFGSESINGVAANKVLNITRGQWFVYSDGTNYFTAGPS